VTTETDLDLGTMAGTCIYESDGSHTTTMIDSTLASCASNEQVMNIVSFELGIVSFSGDTGTGQAHIYLVNVSDALGGNCDFLMDVEYTRQ
jgi:hypothetical protein